MLIPVRTGDAAVAGNEAAPWVRRVPSDVWLLVAITAVGAVLRFATLTGQSYWFDEAQAAHELHLSFGAMLSSWWSNEPNPPLFFVLGWLWSQLFGTGEAGLRSLSALAGTAVIPVAYLCGRELVSRRAGLVAAAFTALCPFMIWYSQEAREYMLLALLCGGSLLFFARLWNEPSDRNLIWWAVLSGLALMTQYFAAFLVAAEAVGVLYRRRDRAAVVTVGALVLLEAALLPHAIDHASHPTGWIDAFPLSVRIQQVPVAFALGTLYQGPAVSHGLIGASVLAGCVIVLLIVGAPAAQLRGAGIAAALAGFVLLAPLALALVGHDYYEARALMPAWIPLAVVVGAACTVGRPRAAGVALGVVLLAGFVWAQLKIDGNTAYQRPDWRGVATALGKPSGTRAVVAYDGTFAVAPLAIYLPGVAWTSKGQEPQTSSAPVTVEEVDVVGSIYQKVPRPLPAGAQLIASKRVNGYLVDRFSLARPWRLPPSAIAGRAPALLGPGPQGAAVLVQEIRP